MGAVTETLPREPRVPRQARSRRTRERILEAAVSCFETRGFDETTTAQIAREAGVAVGTLYGYFTDKRTILLELLQENVEPVAAEVLRGLDPEAWRGRTPRECVRDLVGMTVRTHRHQPGVQRILWERYFKDPDFRAHNEALERRVRTALERMLEALRDEGRVRVTDDAVAAFLVHASVQWISTRLELGNAGADTDVAVDALTDMITRFLFVDAE